MARIVDVKAFLENFPFESTAKPFHFVVKDPVAEWNNGIFGLIWDENDQVTITDEPLGTAVHLDIQTLTCLVMNYRRPSYLHRIERIDTDKDLYLPQENAAINDKSAYADSKMIALADTENVLASDLLVALLDGPTIDAGVASEIGVAYAKGIPVVALYTDSRQQGADNHQKLDALNEVAENQFHYLNLYTVGLIKLNGRVVSSEEDLLEEIKQRLS